MIMSHSSLNQYLLEASSSLKEYDGDAFGNLISFKDPHVANPRLQKEEPESSCQRYLDSPYDELVAAHIKACWYVAAHNFKDAHACQVIAVQAFVRAFQSQKDENWALPIMYALVLDLRNFANKAEHELLSTNKGKKGDTLEKTADVVMGCFRVCASDGRSAISVSKKWGMLFLVNQLFKIYFRFYVGRKAMFDSDYKTADDYLSFAFENCHRNCQKNLKMIMTYMVPVKMLLGSLPSEQLLERYNVTEYWDIAQAVRSGNVLLFNNTLEKNESLFIKTGVYLILEKLRAAVLRTLFKKVAEILKTHQVPLQAFQTALEMQGISDVDMDETECLVAGLIYTGNIRGYISHQHKKLVISKVNAFPPIAAST